MYPSEFALERAAKGLELITVKGYRDRLNPATLNVADPTACPAAQVGEGSMREGLKLLGIDGYDHRTVEEHGFICDRRMLPEEDNPHLTAAFIQLLTGEPTEVDFGDWNPDERMMYY